MLSSIIKYCWNQFHRLSAFLHVYFVRSLVYDQGNVHAVFAGHDFIRVKTLELCRRLIIAGNIRGAVAELGVYKGKYSSIINELFPDRKLYLFDTFSGFDILDSEHDSREGYIQSNQDFTDTSVASVIALMPHPEMCVVIKGRFPESAKGIESIFSFVSIDTDLYYPTKCGLEYFYPRLEKKGYIFVHDYFNDNYKGVREAVNEFCFNEKIHFVPLPDVAGTVVITKNSGEDWTMSENG